MADNFCKFRIKNELKDLILLNSTSIEYTDNIIKYTIHMDQGIYINKEIIFHIYIPVEYPFKSPKIKCISKMIHPSIDSEGNTCLEMIREKWKCTYGIQNILVSLYCLFIDVKCENPLNVEVDKLMREDYDEFLRQVREL